MTITDIIQNKRFKNYYDIHIDGEYMFFVTYKELKFLKLKINDDITEEFLQKIYREYIISRAKNRALRLLTRKDMTRKEIIQKLKLTGYNDYVTNKIILFLEEYNFINDKKYVEKYVNYNQKRKSVKKIGMELTQKGISKDTINEYIENIDFCEEENAYNLLYKKYKNVDTIDNKIKRRMIGYLMRKGYNYSLINKVIDQFMRKKNLTNT
ncbi:hypothetical protein SH1V18_42980 [Vallitalea longa]|uniref:Regulatory protein RecX n=1 Tax=Vallitalea longa TaxID=2936439 RepID=A0A9W6DHU4_9FIRM|nr:regulatory protein RecX [Vallitalea longa]GKX31818.1 hypothetical protein SH1V18_42980 [Vallitalea longa]